MIRIKWFVESSTSSIKLTLVWSGWSVGGGANNTGTYQRRNCRHRHLVGTIQKPVSVEELLGGELGSIRARGGL